MPNKLYHRALPMPHCQPLFVEDWRVSRVRTPLRIAYIMTFLLLLLGSLPEAFSQVDTVSKSPETVEQSAFWRSYLELWAEQNEQTAVSDDLIETLTSIQENPINLNDTGSTQILSLPFISPFQWDIIKAYILQNGPLLSLGELSLMNGFDATTLQLMQPFVTVRPIEENKALNLKDVLRYGHSNLLMGTKTVVEPAQGYLDSSYLGSPYRLYFRYYFKYGDRVCFQFSGDKDPGEEFFSGSQKQGFDSYGYYLLLNNMGRLQSAIIGKYQLQFGQGLTLWSGFAPWTTSKTSLYRYSQGIRHASAFCEYGYLQGLAATVQLTKHTTITPFYSLTRQDASVGASGTDTTESWFDQVQSIYASGYHRTQSEIDSKNRLREQLFGAHLQWSKENLTIGATAYQSLYNKEIIPVSRIYNANAYCGRSNFVAGLDASYRYRRVLVFGELSISEKHLMRSAFSSTEAPLAGLVGLQFNINANNRFGASYRNYSPTYQNLHATAIGQNSDNSNEEGVIFCFQTLLPGHIEAYLYTDFFRCPWMKYRVYSPSQGAEYRVFLTKEFASNFVLSMQYGYKSSGRNASVENIDTGNLINTYAPLQDAHSYVVEQFSRHQLQGSLEYRPNTDWRFSTRIAHVWTQCEYHPSEQGFLLLQDVSYSPSLFPKPLTVTARYAAFDVTDYDARLYALEGDFMYEFATPVLLNQGSRCYLLVKCDITQDIAVALKYARTMYSNCETIGSGNDMTKGPIRQEIKLQVRLKW